MTDIVDTEEQLSGAHISEVKSLAKRYGIKAQRDWSKEKLIEAILEAQAEGRTMEISSEEEDVQAEADRLIANYSLPEQRIASAAKGPPKPGYARIIIHKDPTPGHANSPVQVGLNGRYMNVPRGVASDLPIEYLGVLRDALHIVRKQTEEPSRSKPDGVWTEDEVLSYPYQIVAITPGGKWVNNEDQRSISAQRRKAFHTRFKRWPTEGELIEWEKQQVVQAGK